MKNTIVGTTYRAFEIASPGNAALVVRSVGEPGPTQVWLRVLACGLSRHDFDMYSGAKQAAVYPRVPGQELVGIIESVGTEVVGWRIGQRVGCSSFGGSCAVCPACRRGDAIHCAHLAEVGKSVDGASQRRFLSKREL